MTRRRRVPSLALWSVAYALFLGVCLFSLLGWSGWPVLSLWAGAWVLGWYDIFRSRRRSWRVSDSRKAAGDGRGPGHGQR